MLKTLVSLVQRPLTNKNCYMEFELVWLLYANIMIPSTGSVLCLMQGLVFGKLFQTSDLCPRGGMQQRGHLTKRRYDV